MPHFSDERILPYSPQQLYDLVIDIESYPDFLPWCVDARITQQDPDYLLADVTAGYLFLTETYTSKVTYDPYYAIQAEYIKGPFKHLRNDWEFISHPQGCELKFYVDFEFANGFFNKLANHVLIEVTERMVEAFIARARHIYPNPASTASF
jgi:coenzyme Q-binding protein COQ10